jgi:hypothetical protein
MSGPDHDRRSAPRVRPGRDVTIVNIAERGALVETTCRLLPGSSVELSIATIGGPIAVRGRIAHAAVFRLHADLVVFRSGVEFVSTCQVPA